MAQRVQTLYIDDLDGSEADSTVHFGLDGAGYEIDLNVEHAEDLRKVLAQYVDAARRVTAARPGRAKAPRRQGAPRPRTGQPPAADVPQATFVSGAEIDMNSEKIRQWARDHRLPVKDKGRISASLTTQYVTAQEKEIAAEPNRAAAN